MISISKPIGISLPEDLIAKIDKLRGDVTRSMYIRRLLEKALR